MNCGYQSVKDKFQLYNTNKSNIEPFYYKNKNNQTFSVNLYKFKKNQCHCGYVDPET